MQITVGKYIVHVSKDVFSRFKIVEKGWMVRTARQNLFADTLSLPGLLFFDSLKKFLNLFSSVMGCFFWKVLEKFC